MSAAFDLIVDVRSKLEFLFGHLPNAVCIPVNHLPDDLVKRADVQRNSRILLYCASGARSAAAAAQLKAAGFTNVVDGGGMAAARRYVEA
jgi:phage shock protein E